MGSDTLNQKFSSKIELFVPLSSHSGIRFCRDHMLEKKSLNSLIWLTFPRGEIAANALFLVRFRYTNLCIGTKTRQIF